MDNNLDFCDILTKLDEIDVKIDHLQQYNSEKLDNTLLNLKIGELSAKLDIARVKNEKLSERIAVLQATIQTIEEYTRIARPDQDHLPNINKLARKALEK